MTSCAILLALYHRETTPMKLKGGSSPFYGRTRQTTCSLRQNRSNRPKFPRRIASFSFLRYLKYDSIDYRYSAAIQITRIFYIFIRNSRKRKKNDTKERSEDWQIDVSFYLCHSRYLTIDDVGSENKRTRAYNAYHPMSIALTVLSYHRVLANRVARLANRTNRLLSSVFIFLRTRYFVASR